MSFYNKMCLAILSLITFICIFMSVSYAKNDQYLYILEPVGMLLFVIYYWLSSVIDYGNPRRNNFAFDRKKLNIRLIISIVALIVFLGLGVATFNLDISLYVKLTFLVTILFAVFDIYIIYKDNKKAKSNGK